jgi:uncharacterized protein YhbP (UPF0306 family)
MEAVMPEFEFDQEVGLFLATCRTAALATVHPDGRPHCANVQYASDDQWRLYWVSSPQAQHSEHIARDQRVALTIYAADDRAMNIHGLQLTGVCEALEQDEDANRAWEVYTAKFTFVSAMPQFRDAVASQTFYRMTPTWLRWIDNRRGFGWKAEKTLAGSEK